MGGVSDLLTSVLDAHGGTAAFAGVTTLTAEMSFGGPFWAARGWPGALDDVTVRLDTAREHIEVSPYPHSGSTLVYDVDSATGAERIALVDAAGAVIESRDDPRPGFPAFSMTVPWDALQTAYFVGVATWNYLMEPFLFARPDVTTTELDPWVEGGETWRRLEVTFPPQLPNHNPAQVFYFDDRFLLRRMDYQPDVTGAPIAHYTHDPRTFDGFVFYTRRLVHPRKPDGQAVQDVVAISIDTSSVAVG
jgi:hypothetical protein